ncbi:XrtB/PEP-CTERM-associated polysaccharide biosynthesis outer membrane protein EpsL [Dechloromonas sp. HYN0024]|uniref:XrtB/PEP-CTERM-associated polysaccharide biosynthesis outer membrane protein EpsL n=1 Tax=Dechloromonas sp. HYN0024 TaxID=2231055 RepID=UPI000E4402B2|nr:XrtB/PEP-CTERM-associated polysaccharide biosynthesis outer membrane protein EpsL [Dechloromonas sp. HYN0024]AXS80122.1 hypothetical protein HYN24_08880 [Dechloromonas sp. HYN0024]
MHSNPPRWRTLPLLLLLLASGVSADEADAFNIFGGSTVVFDDNIFRLAPGTSAKAVFGTDQRSDVIRTSFVGGSFDKLIGRQRLKLDMTLNSVNFSRFSQLNNTGGNISGAVNWQLTDDLTGTVGKSRNRSMPGYRDQRTLVKNILSVDNEYLNADLRLQPSWHLEAMTSQVASSYSAEANKISNNTVDSYTLGVRYTPASGNYIRLKNTWSTGQYPNQQFVSGALVDNGFSQTDAALEMLWVPSGASRLNGLLAHTERTHQNVPQRNFSGWTGNASWAWSLTGKLTMVSSFRREIGAQNELLSSYALTDAYNLASIWTPSTKTSVRLSYERATRNFLGDPVAVLSFLTKRSDKIETFSLTASYQPFRNLNLSLSAIQEKRESNYANLNYDDNILMGSAQYTF